MTIRKPRKLKALLFGYPGSQQRLLSFYTGRRYKNSETHMDPRTLALTETALLFEDTPQAVEVMLHMVEWANQ